MVGSFSRAFGGCRANFSKFRGSHARFTFNSARAGSRRKVKFQLLVQLCASSADEECCNSWQSEPHTYYQQLQIFCTILIYQLFLFTISLKLLQFHAETGKPRVFSNIFNQQRKTTFDNVRVTAFPPYNSSVCALLVSKLELGGARLNSSSVSSGGGISGGML